MSPRQQYQHNNNQDLVGSGDFDDVQPLNKKIKLSTNDQPIVLLLLDESLGSTHLQQHYQQVINRDVKQFVILQFMNDFGRFINHKIMKEIPHEVPFQKLCRERDVILSLIKAGLLYNSMNGSFVNSNKYLERDKLNKELMFKKHQFETLDQYKQFITDAIVYDREGSIYDLVDDDMRNDFEFSLRATIACPQILFRYPYRFLNVEFAVEYTKREHPKSVMKKFLEDFSCSNDSVLSQSISERLSQLDLPPPSPFQSASQFIATRQNEGYAYFHTVRLNAVCPPMNITLEKITLLGKFVDKHRSRLKCGMLLGNQSLEEKYLTYYMNNLDVKCLANPQHARELGLLLGYLYNKSKLN